MEDESTPGHLSGLNSQTVVGSLTYPRALDARASFERHHALIQERLHRYDQPGLLALVLGRREIAGQWLRAKPNQTTTAIVGRHERCDLVTPASGADVSLRHVAILASDLDQTFSFRVIDLASGTGFIDEDQRPQLSIQSSGPTFLGIGASVLFLSPTPYTLDGDSSRSFINLPKRVVVPDDRSKPRSSGSDAITYVHTSPGPLPLGDRVDDGFQPAGFLSLESDGRIELKPVSERMLERGVLVGRYDRCRIRAPVASLSRVHLLLIRDGRKLLAVDAASTNGTYFQGEEKRTTTLEFGDCLSLGQDVKVTWSRPD